jgi:hypothetical protein
LCFPAYRHQSECQIRAGGEHTFHWFNGASQDLGVSFWRFCIGMDLDMKLMIFFLIRIIESIAVKSMRQSEIGDGAILA